MVTKIYSERCYKKINSLIPCDRLLIFPHFITSDSDLNLNLLTVMAGPDSRDQFPIDCRIDTRYVRIKGPKVVLFRLTTFVTVLTGWRKSDLCQNKIDIPL